MSGTKPIFLLADSQLLFYQEGSVDFLQRIKQLLEHSCPKAAYLGASNDNEPAFFELFQAAMAKIGITDCRFVIEFSQEDKRYLEQADVIFFAGGDTEKGWQVFQQHKLQELIGKCYLGGAILMGLSAGAVQLGTTAWTGQDKDLRCFTTFQFVPYIIGVHEDQQWSNLQQVLAKQANTYAKAIGIPKGGGLVVYPDLSIEAIRYAVTVLEPNQEPSLLLPIQEHSEASDTTTPALPASTTLH